jgi:hypothetical protein
VNSFDDVLLRFKSAVGARTDKDAGALLGLADKAFNARKRRGVFPIDKLYVLASQRPDLKIDVNYIVTGESKEFRTKIDALREATEAAMKFELPSDYQIVIRDILFAVYLNDSNIAKSAIDQFVASQKNTPRMTYRVQEEPGDYDGADEKPVKPKRGPGL